MKLKMKLLAAAVALVAASGANANITVETSASTVGELFFTLYDAGADLSSTADDRAYVRDLGTLTNTFANFGGTMNDWVSATTTAPLPALNANKQGFGTIYSVAADANLQSFLSASTDTSRLKWNIMAADSNGTDRILVTGTNALPGIGGVSFRNNATQIGVYLAAMNPALPGSTLSALYSGADASIGLFGSNNGGRLAFDNTAGLGGSLGFFVLSERSTTSNSAPDVRQFMADQTTAMEWTLAANGELTYGAVAAIPEPSEYALMLAGLGMLGFMARRRLSNRV